MGRVRQVSLAERPSSLVEPRAPPEYAQPQETMLKNDSFIYRSSL
jgi:hypothetical protein